MTVLELYLLVDQLTGVDKRWELMDKDFEGLQGNPSPVGCSSS